MPDEKDYFTALGKSTQPIRDAFSRAPKAATAAKGPVGPKAPDKVASYKAYFDDDSRYMNKANDANNRRLFKAGPGKSFPKR